jgi:hypothetical protein
MPNLLARWLLCATLLLPGPAHAASSGAKALFDHAAGAWGVGTIRLGKPLKFREGKVLVFPSQFADLLWAPTGKPRNLMLVYEVPSDEAEKPFFGDKDEFFAPIRLLPEQSYWRDNLPATPRHEVAGGKRNVFRGEEIAEAKKALGPFLEASGIKGKERRSAQAAAVAAALGSTVTRIREDAGAWLAGAPNLDKILTEAALASLASYLQGTAPAAERAALITALASAKVAGLKPTFQAIADKDDAAGASALAALAALGQSPATR